MTAPEGYCPPLLSVDTQALVLRSFGELQNFFYIVENHVVLAATVAKNWN